jgi:hypothetical protein
MMRSSASDESRSVALAYPATAAQLPAEDIPRILALVTTQEARLAMVKAILVTRLADRTFAPERLSCSKTGRESV